MTWLSRIRSRITNYLTANFGLIWGDKKLKILLVYAMKQCGEVEV
jgi:hypothetical protein